MFDTDLSERTRRAEGSAAELPPESDGALHQQLQGGTGERCSYYTGKITTLISREIHVGFHENFIFKKICVKFL